MSFFIRGQVITNLEELYNQEFIIYLMGPRCKVLHRGWFVSWQLSFTKRLIKQVVVYPENKRPYLKDCPKTKYSERDFIIPQPLLYILNSVPNKTGFIVHGKDCQQPISLSTFQRMYREAFKTLGIENFNNHDWRTTYGTQLKEAGMTSAQVADMLGHADTRMVEKVYAPRRHEGIMKHKNTLEILNQAYTRGTSVAPKTAL